MIVSHLCTKYHCSDCLSLC